jgi:small subunit ribosomal protein S2
MISFIYGKRNGLNVINLDTTIPYLRRALKVTKEIAARNGKILFVTDRPSTHKTILDAATSANQFYALEWKNGIITNKNRMLRRSVGFDPDKVSQSLMKTSFDSDSTEIVTSQPYVPEPDLILVFDYKNCVNAINEASNANIPVVAICDSDCDPTKVLYPVPANDDSVTGISLLAKLFARAAKEGRRVYLKNSETESQTEIHSLENLA